MLHTTAAYPVITETEQTAFTLSFLKKKDVCVLLRNAFKHATSFQVLYDHVELKVKVPVVM